MIADLAAALGDEARRANERRALVLTGEREDCYAGAREVLDGAEIRRAATTLVADEDGRLDCERIGPKHADRLLGRTRRAVVLDCHEECRPNAIGRTVGAVDGGGLFIVLAPPLDAWPDRRDGFDATLAVPPYDIESVAGNFRRRLVELLRAHRGIAIVNADSRTIECDGLTDPPPREQRTAPAAPGDHEFPRAAYETCLTADQTAAVSAFEDLREPGTALVVEADRGRGKSSAAGLAAGALAAEGKNVLVTAPAYRSAAPVFERARGLLAGLDALAGADSGDPPRRLDAVGGGRVCFAKPAAAVERAPTADVVVIDEAAALPVGRLTEFLDALAVAFVTTVHGYEGAGRGFSVRFRDRLADSDFTVAEQRLDDPIRYAAGDPIEVWVFRALALDARPPVAPLVEQATPESVTYRRFDSTELLTDEHRLREVFGLLVAAHYRTEPNDLARLLDAPNVSVHALLQAGHVVSVALCAHEGNLSEDLRRKVYEGSRIKGHLLPDALTSQLRDEQAGVPTGQRVLRIATHPAARSRGLGSRLLDELRHHIDADWLGVGYGATPELVRFWDRNDFSTVYLATTRNERSGEHSALMLTPLSSAGEELHDRHARRFVERVGAALSDPLDDLAPDVVRIALAATDAIADIDFTDHEWRVAASAADGPGLAEIHPHVFRALALGHLTDSASSGPSAREERLLVMRVLQARPTEEVVDALDYDSTGACMRALGDAYKPLVERYGNRAAREERDRYADERD